MMPNVAGDASTRRQIMAYTAALVLFAFVPCLMASAASPISPSASLAGLACWASPGAS